MSAFPPLLEGERTSVGLPLNEYTAWCLSWGERGDIGADSSAIWVTKQGFARAKELFG